MDSLRLHILAGDSRAPGAHGAAAADVVALRARGHDVVSSLETPGHAPACTTAQRIAAPPHAVLSYGWSDAARDQRTTAPRLHLGQGPATDRAAGAPTEAIAAAWDRPRFKAVTSPGAQRQVLLEHGGRCWIVPAGVPPTCLTSRRTAAGAARVAVLDPYQTPIEWVDETLRRLGADARVELSRVGPGAGGRREQLAVADIVIVPAHGPDDGVASLALEAAALGCAVLMADAEPFHELVPSNRGDCFVPVDDPAAVARRIAALAVDEGERRALREVACEMCRTHAMPKRIDALESALTEILASTEPAPVTTSMWLPCAHGTRAESRYTFAAQFVMDRNVLDLACGDGSGTVRLADGGARSVIGVDRSELAIARAERLRARDVRLRFACMPAEALDLADGSVDLVVAFGVADGPAEPDAIITEAARVLARHGTLLISRDNPAKRNEPALASESWELDALRERLEATFGRVTLFAERIEQSGLIIRGGVLDPCRDAGWIAMATRPTRLPAAPATGHDATGARRRDRHAA